MENEIMIPGQIYEGVVTGIQPYGAFVRFPNGQQGLIHISEISSRFVRHITDFLQIGKNVRVKVLEIDEKSHDLRLSLKQVTERERQIVRKPPNLRRRRPESNTKADFQILADHLDEWIEVALKKEENKND